MALSKQTWDAERYARNARFVSDLSGPVVELLAPQPGERILDLGCGDGVLTEKLAAMGCSVVGIDNSPEFVDAARERGLETYPMDANSLTFSQEFDAVFSNAVLHWIKEPRNVIRGVWRALKPNGRFVAEFGGYGCVDNIVAALYAALRRRGIDGDLINPWYFPTVEDYGSRLKSQGFIVKSMELVARPTVLPGDVTGWLETFAISFISVLPAKQRPAFIEELRESLQPVLCDGEGKWTADYVRLRFAAIKPESRLPGRE